MKYAKFETTISGENNTIVIVSTENPIEDTTVTQTPIIRTHHIALGDRSGSMYYSLDKLLDQQIQVCKSLPVTDLFSSVWYSGPNQTGVIVEGVPGGTDITNQLKNYRQTVGSTCFSSALDETLKTVVKFNNKVDQTNLVIFTDGQPVVSWSLNEEETRSRASVERMVANGLSSMLCIGFGNYYNREFLLKLADIPSHGKIMHNSRIDEFLEAFEHSIGSSSVLVKRPFKFGQSYFGSDQAKWINTLYVNESDVKLYDFDINLETISSVSNDFYLINPTKNHKFDIHFDDTIERLEEKSFPIATQEQKDRFFYAYASKLYYYGKRLKALEIIVHNCKDKYLANIMINAFTNSEVAEAQKALDAAVFDTSKRLLEGKCGPNFIPAKDALCVMDIFNRLFDQNASVYYIPFSKNVEKYKRIGKKVEDQANIFTPNKNEVRKPLTELVWNKDKLNLSISFQIPGTVKLNPVSVKNANKSAEKSKAPKLEKDFPATIFNSHTFVKDGTMNVEYAEFLMDNDTYDTLNKMGVKSKQIAETTSNLVRTVLDFTKLPIINQLYLENANDLDSIFDLTKENAELQAKQLVLNREIKRVYEAMPKMLKEDLFAKYTNDQIRVLTEHGISEKGVYGGIERKVNTDSPDSYEIRILDFSLAGLKSTPNGADFEKAYAEFKTKGNLPANHLRKVMVEYYEDLSSRFNLSKISEKLRDNLNKELETFKSKLAENRQKISKVKLAKVLNNDFFEGLTKDDKGNLFFEKNQFKMIVESKRKMENI